MSVDTATRCCSFHGRGKGECGGSRGKENEYVKLASCNKDLSNHLSSCHLTRSLQEYQIILARSGHFQWTDNLLEKMLICPYHRDNLGQFWRPPTSCKYPAHKGKPKRLKDRHAINIELAKQIMDIYGVIVPIGSPICSTCRTKHAAKLKDEASWIIQSDDPTDSKESEDIILNEMMSNLHFEVQTPEVSRKDPLWLPGSLIKDGCSSFESVNTNNVLHTFNEAISSISNLTQYEVSPLHFQLKRDWEDASKEEKNVCAEKAEEICKIVCDVIAPNNGEKLLDSLKHECAKDVNISGELETLMTAYSNAPSRRLKLQILSLYAYRYPVNKLIDIHEPYEKITKWQIKNARTLAREIGPGSIPEKRKMNRIRIDRAKLDHFIEFVNRPYFYQDVAFGMRTLTLESGERIDMPNIIRTVSRSTMIAEYLKFCREDHFSPLGRSTMFRILDVREASQRASLQGLDNIAADGASGFHVLERIVDDLGKLDADKEWIRSTRKKLTDGKLYLKVRYPVHCSDSTSLCADHCRQYSLSDPSETEFVQQCDHEHLMKCDECESLQLVLKEIEEEIYSLCRNSNLQEQREDFMHDLQQAKRDIMAWKAHILRSVNQEKGKEDNISCLDEHSVLIVMDWAMKFQQRKYREKQSEWFGKRGLSWHVSSVISKEGTEVQVQSYTHLLDSCTQEWFSVLSILENILKTVRKNNPKITHAYLRSDEAGCYHNNMLIAGCKDISKMTGVTVLAYNYSEPQHGKDICDRMIAPMKAAINKYCCEGNDILTAGDMHKALKERPVKGVTAAVANVCETKNNLKINKIEKFSSYHNYKFEKGGIRVWKAYGIGEGKYIPDNTIYIKHQQSPSLEVSLDNGFFESKSRGKVKVVGGTSNVSEDSRTLECSEPGCTEAFDTFADLDLHLAIGKHEIPALPIKEGLYDTLRKDWASIFSTVPNAKRSNMDKFSEDLMFGESESKQGWALSTPAPVTRFPDHVKSYLIKRFDCGEKTGLKADPGQVAEDMRKARNVDGQRSFTRNEWLKKSQIKSFFSRIAASRRKQQLTPSETTAEELLEIQETELTEWEEHQSNQELLRVIDEDMGVQHPVLFDVYDICENFRRKTLHRFNVVLLKEMLDYFEIPYKSKDRKQDLINKLAEMVQDCSCQVSK